jgi:hypothetical protein
MAAGSRQAAEPREIGAYGLRLEQVERARSLLLAADASWPRLRIRRKVGTGTARLERITEHAAILRPRSGGEIAIDRYRGEATFLLPRLPSTAELVHPLLAPVAAVMARWLGRESFHASAFVVGGRAWGIIGQRGSGKSTLAARLALDGLPVVCDDMLVLEHGRALAAPRSIDLRREAAARLDAGEPLGVVGTRERWRLPLDPVPAESELAGWFSLAWGDRVEVVPLRPRGRLARLHEHRGVRLPPRDPEALLALASLPAWELRRPRRWSSLAASADCALDVAG